MNTQGCWFLANLGTFQLTGGLLLLLGIAIFAGLLIKIRYLLLEKLIAAFNPFYWLIMVILKWFWREPGRYKRARGAK
jgi:hypothetical protein